MVGFNYSGKGRGNNNFGQGPEDPGSSGSDDNLQNYNFNPDHFSSSTGARISRLLDASLPLSLAEARKQIDMIQASGDCKGPGAIPHLSSREFREQLANSDLSTVYRVLVNRSITNANILNAVDLEIVAVQLASNKMVTPKVIEEIDRLLGPGKRTTLRMNPGRSITVSNEVFDNRIAAFYHVIGNGLRPQIFKNRDEVRQANALLRSKHALIHNFEEASIKRELIWDDLREIGRHIFGGLWDRNVLSYDSNNSPCYAFIDTISRGFLKKSDLVVSNGSQNPFDIIFEHRPRH